MTKTMTGSAGSTGSTGSAGSAGSAGSLLSTAARAALVLAITCGAGRCGSAPASIDLVAALPTAERRALAAPDVAIHATVVSRDGADQPALVTDAPARVIFPVNMPGRARFRTAVALQSPAGTGVTVRMGIADSRSYDELLRVSVEPPQRRRRSVADDRCGPRRVFRLAMEPLLSSVAHYVEAGAQRGRDAGWKRRVAESLIDMRH